MFPRHSLNPIRTAAILALATATLTACDESSGPSDDVFDAERALTNYGAMDALLDGPALRSFAALGMRVPAGVVTSVAQGPVSPAILLISAAAQGKTFVYDAARDEYVISDRAGAPANGVRFILYAVDAATGKPDAAHETGQADLLDLGQSGNDRIQLRLVAENDGRTFLDYSLELVPRSGAGSIHVDGFLSSPEDRLDFDIDVTERVMGGRERYDVDFQLAIDERDFSVDGSLRAASGRAGKEGDLDLVARHGGHSVRVDATSTEQQLDATFYVNNQVLATAVGPHANPVIENQDGEPLSARQWAALAYIVHFGEGIFELVECLVEPVEGLVGLAFIL
jgi:hypothetical protein